MNFFLKKTTEPKVFCIGLNKTGTTTIENELIKFGYKTGNQVEAEYLVKNWYQRDFKPILRYCKKYDAFQDVPFSLPFTYQVLDQYFSSSKFILTVRDNPEQWYKSLVEFHSKLWGNGKDALTLDQLKKVNYRHLGYAYKTHRDIFNTPDKDLYNKEILINYYNNHLENVKEYFRSQPEKLLVINVSIKKDYFRLCEFLEKPVLRENFLWKNKTERND